jgi:hypothetical protein
MMRIADIAFVVIGVWQANTSALTFGTRVHMILTRPMRSPHAGDYGFVATLGCFLLTTGHLRFHGSLVLSLKRIGMIARYQSTQYENFYGA